MSTLMSHTVPPCRHFVSQGWYNMGIFICVYIGHCKNCLGLETTITLASIDIKSPSLGQEGRY